MDHLLSPATAAVTTRWGFSDVVATRGLLFCSGVTGARSDGSVDDDPAAQFEVAFTHLAEALALAGATTADLVEITTYHVGLQAHFEAFAAVKARHVAAPHPAWSAIGVAELAVPGTLVEIRAVAEDPRAPGARGAQPGAQPG